MERILSRITGSKKLFSLEYRIFNATLFAGIVLTLVSGISNFCVGLPQYTYLFPLANSIVFIGLYFFSLSKNRISEKRLFIISRISFAYILFIFFPLNWFLNGGSSGGFQYFFIFFLIILITTMPGKKGAFIVLYFLTIITILLIEYYFPEYIFNYSTRADRYIDLVTSYILLYLAVFVVINIFLKMYQEANARLKQQKEEIQITGNKLELANKKLEEINKTKDKFFSIIAHDLKSPFNSMLGFSNLLNDSFDEFSKSEQKEYIGIIHKNIQNTYKLLENLLVWSRTQKGSITYSPDKENLSLLSSEIIQVTKLSAENKSIELKNEIDSGIYINADKNMVSTILRNLINNAIKFTPKNGEIVIKAQKSKDDFVKVSIQDNGIGISTEIKSQLFDISKNTSTKGTENETGTGLGLLICKEFVEKHGGKIWIDSKIDVGSTFNFTIPEHK